MDTREISRLGVGADPLQLCALGGGMVIFIIQAQYGLGKHRDTISKLDYVEYSKVGFFQSIISAIAALAFLKISIALSLLRLSKNPWYSRSLWALIGIQLPILFRHNTC